MTLKIISLYYCEIDSFRFCQKINIFCWFVLASSAGGLELELEVVWFSVYKKT